MKLGKNCKNIKIKFVIVAPPTLNGGGPIVLHELYKCLNLSGYKTKMLYYYKEENPSRFLNFLFSIKLKFAQIVKKVLNIFFKTKYDTRILNYKMKIIPKVDDNTLVIYPEVVYGNFLKAKNVIRWLLYHYKYGNDQKAFGENDLFITFRDVFNDKKLNPDNLKLYLTYFDFNLYQNYNEQNKTGTCYIIRKGSKRQDLPKSFDGIVIDHLREEDKVKVFNKCEKCISYDTQTAYSQIAALCGCLSIVVPEPGKSRKDYLEQDDFIPGVAYGFSESEISYAKETMGLVKEKFEKDNINSLKNVQDFIKLCQEKFKF